MGWGHAAFGTGIRAPFAPRVSAAGPAKIREALTCNEANQDGAPGLNDKVSRGADGNTARERRVLDIDHVKLVVRAQEVGEGKGADAAGAQAEDGVDDDAVLRRTRGKSWGRGRRGVSVKRRQQTGHRSMSPPVDALPAYRR